MMKNNKEVAKEIIVNYFDSICYKQQELSKYVLVEKMLVQTDDEILLEHIKTLRNILDKAIKEMGAENK